MNPEHNNAPIDDLNSAATELYLSADYYQHKANECRDVIEHLVGWSETPNCRFDFSCEGQPVASFKIGPSDNDVLQTVFMSLCAYYQRKAGQERVKLDELTSGRPTITDLATSQDSK